MSNVIPEIVGEIQTSDSTISSIVSWLVPINFYGEISVDVIGELVGTPTVSFYWQNTYLVSQELGVATIRATGAIPFVLDPASVSPGITVDVSTVTTNLLRVRVTGFAGQVWNWTAHIGGMLHSRIPDGAMAYYDPAVASAQTPYQDFAYT